MPERDGVGVLHMLGLIYTDVWIYVGMAAAVGVAIVVQSDPVGWVVLAVLSLARLATASRYDFVREQNV